MPNRPNRYAARCSITAYECSYHSLFLEYRRRNYCGENKQIKTNHKIKNTKPNQQEKQTKNPIQKQTNKTKTKPNYSVMQNWVFFLLSFENHECFLISYKSRAGNSLAPKAILRAFLTFLLLSCLSLPSCLSSCCYLTQAVASYNTFRSCLSSILNLGATKHVCIFSHPFYLAPQHLYQSTHSRWDIPSAVPGPTPGRNSRHTLYLKKWYKTQAQDFIFLFSTLFLRY